MKKILVISLPLLLLFGFTNFTLAAVCDSCNTNADCGGLTCIGDPNPGDGKKEGVCQDPNNIVFCSPIIHTTFGALIDAIIKFIFNVAIVVVPLLIIIGAFSLLTAAGDPKKITTGKNIITYTLIGLAIILLAKGLIAIIEEVLGIRIGG